MSKNLTYNEKEGRYEQNRDGHTVYANTHMKDDVLYIDYVYAPPELRGKGAASAFMKDIMALVRDKGWKAKPVCGFAAGWLAKHTEYDDLLQK